MNDSLLQVLNSRLEVAKRFSKDYQTKVKEWIELYEAETPKVKSIEDLIERDQRYQYTAKVVFDNVEKYRSSFFEMPPEVMYSKKGKNDEEKAAKITAAWEYLKDKINFKQFMDDTYTYFGLCGFVSGHVGYRKETTTTTGEDGIEYTKFLFDDPILEVYDHENEWFMPDSEFSPDARNISYFRKKKMTKSQAFDAFEVDVEADEEVLSSENKDEDKEGVKSELKRCGVYTYVGTLPKKELLEYIESMRGEESEEEPVQQEHDEQKDISDTRDVFYVYFNKSKILKVKKSPIGEQACALGRWYASPKKFFGFGLAKQLEEQQRQQSIRTGQLVRYADLLAFPKLAVNLKDKGTDAKALMDRNNPVLTYVDQKPEYITPPSSNGAIAAMQGQNQSDIQMNSGLTDISKTQQSKTLQTATGQTQVADSNEKRVKTAKDKYYEFLKHIIIKVFKFAQAEWQEEKVQTITDEDGNTQDVSMTREDFADINFDTDISIDFENISVNKDVVRQQSIVMYDKIKDDPLVNREKVFKKMLKDGFGEKNPDQFIKQSTIAPGMTFMGADGQQYVADETGTVVLQEAMNELAPASDGTMQPASDQSAVQGNALNVGV